ncbi:serine hydrolase domain-containing protein [Sphingomonas sp.]|uniref:serine hydrolase domain-containing protein n=1 Tax=Sphingomonas sp. TaxID=28214 RepID=UPI001EC76D01|nr:serine hydrolase domain-containing protein [Sphingomonas sp.]MBX3594120.1 beta-lactamase family protein [Sphingomonas sp.]
MTYRIALAAALALTLPVTAQAQVAAPGPAVAADRVASPDQVAEAARQAMADTGAKGLAIAVIDNGRVASVQSFGIRNAAGDPLTPDTIMYGASLTKALFAYYAMTLVDDGRLDLDRPIADMLPRPLPDYGNLDRYGNWGDLKDDPRWRRITPRMVLTHSTGFANFAFLEPDGKLRIHFDPGSRYAYSGEGIELLQFGIESGLGIDLGTALQMRVFDPLHMPRTSLIWRPAYRANLADGWTAEGKVEPHDERSRVRAAGSMDTTIRDLANFAAALVRGQGLSPAAHAQMLRPTLPIMTAQQFPSLLPDAPPEKRVADLAAGLGVLTFAGPQGPGFYKGGHNDSTGNTLVCVQRGQRCVLILANDVRAEAAFPALVRTILGETGVPYRWEYPELFTGK